MSEWLSKPMTDTSTVGIRVPADLAQLTMLRALAETVALIADFALDEVTDIRVALDEVATSLIVAAAPGSDIECEFDFDDEQMSVRVSAFTAEEDALDQDGFGWHVLQTITETITARRRPFDELAGGYPTVIEFSRLRGEVDDG
ncbi:ATP-binding protein [Nocardia huaxiensis]|uniref:Anti-sigma factor n=1 Tax=Nocardia huaxiensis TaxID=2755382 RepID=A0A7D6Z634_9NOCA|nr:anti-sigma factor [Nocardia huaxiensis]QLY27668.1 anti-sigma factor [Nocardia huaxiensis]UFS98943.1 ATP-binding protein [Nocardia huaxiensis]